MLIGWEFMKRGLIKLLQMILQDIKNKLNTLFSYFKPRKIVAQYKLFFGDEWLECSVDSIAPYVYKILFVVSDVAWGDDVKNPQIQGDDLEPILDKLKVKYPDKVIIIRGAYNEQLKHVQAGLSYIKKQIPEATHCLYIDGDEIYKQEQIKKLLSLTKNFKYFNSAIRIQYNLYFKTPYYKIVPKRWPTALVLFPIRDYIIYLNQRNGVSAKVVDLPNIYYEHLAYVRKDDFSIRNKLLAHSQDIEPINPNWFEDVWLKWDKNKTNFHPYNSEWWAKVEELNEVEIDPKILEKFKSFKP